MIHAVFAKSAFGTVVSVTADAVKTSFAVSAQHIVGAVFTFFAAFPADDRTSGTAVSAYADVVSAHFAKRTFIAKATVTAGASVAGSAFDTDVSVRTVFTVFAALGTDISTFRAARTAGTDRIHAILAKLTLLAVVALSANAFKAGHAGKTKLIRGTFGTFFTAILTAKGTIGATVAAIAYPFGTFDTDIAVRTVCFISDALKTFLAFATYPITSGAFLAAILADRFAYFITASAFVLAFTALKTEFAVITQTAVFNTFTA